MPILIKVIIRVGIMLFSIWGLGKFEEMRYNRMKKKSVKEVENKKMSQDDIRQTFRDRGWRVAK